LQSRWGKWRGKARTQLSLIIIGSSIIDVSYLSGSNKIMTLLEFSRVFFSLERKEPKVQD
jgi:hypothetical protein